MQVEKSHDFIAAVLLNVVHKSLGEDNNGIPLKKIRRKKIEKARNYLLNNPIAHLYFILLGMDVDAVLSHLKTQWENMDRMRNDDTEPPKTLH